MLGKSNIMYFHIYHHILISKLMNLLLYKYCNCRFDNIIGKETINTFKYLTSEIKSIFCHPTMVDRVAAMLNYFLCHLVGPKKKNFKVITCFIQLHA